MKKTVWGFMVALLLLFGCGNSSFQSVSADRAISTETASKEARAVRENLMGICRAIAGYGLIPDREIKAYVQGKIARLLRVGDENESAFPEIRAEMRRTIRAIMQRYLGCQPAIAEQIRAQLDGEAPA